MLGGRGSAGSLNIVAWAALTFVVRWVRILALLSTQASRKPGLSDRPGWESIDLFLDHLALIDIYIIWILL
jgi:hypothetical protein